MAGAQVVTMRSALLSRGIDYLELLESDVLTWMESHEYKSTNESRGCMNVASLADRSPVTRAPALAPMHRSQPLLMDEEFEGIGYCGCAADTSVLKESVEVQKGDPVEKRPKVVIVMARCSQSKQNFGIRFEERKRPGEWAADWAFAINAASAKREGYDRGEIAGSFWFDGPYPGCPSCHARSIFKCRCGKVACWDGERQIVTCPWCDATGELRGSFESLSAGTDR